MITETWYVDGPVFQSSITDLEAGHGLGAVCHNRKDKSERNTGGGVALIFRKVKAAFKPYPIKRNGCELLAVKGKLADCSKHLFVIAAYIPPGLRRNQLNRYRESIDTALIKIKLEEKKPRIIFCGNINNYDLDPVFEDHLDFKQDPSPPTRGTERLDLIYTNFTDRC